MTHDKIVGVFASPQRDDAGKDSRIPFIDALQHKSILYRTSISDASHHSYNKPKHDQKLRQRVDKKIFG